MTSLIRAALAALALPLLLPALAGARTIAREGETIVYRAAPGETNLVELVAVPSGDVRVEERGISGGLEPGPGCRLASFDEYAPEQVHCALAGVRELVVELGDGDDQLLTDGVALPLRVDGGDGKDEVDGGSAADVLSGSAGDDVLNGAAGADQLDGGPGEDALSGGGGDDRIAARDGEPDRVLCGAGSDTAVGDLALGALDGDAFDGCETRDAEVPGGGRAVVGWSGRDARGRWELELSTMPGARDDVRVHASDGELRFTVAGGVAPGPPCRRPDPADRTRAVCAIPAGGRAFAAAYLALGDGDDRAVATRAPGARVRTNQLALHGEAGDDRLDAAGWAGPRFFAADGQNHRDGAGIFGGPGRDVLIGSPAGDVIAGGPAADTVRPGPGFDTVDDGNLGHDGSGADTIDLRDGNLDRYDCVRGARVRYDALDLVDWPCDRRPPSDTRSRGTVDAQVLGNRRLTRAPGTFWRARIGCPPSARGGCWGGVRLPGVPDAAPFALRPGQRTTMRVPSSFHETGANRLIVVTRDARGRTSTRSVRVRYPRPL